jgi:hypothetical protein
VTYRFFQAGSFEAGNYQQRSFWFRCRGAAV